MKGILIRWGILTMAIMMASYLLDGIRVSGFFSAFWAAAVLGFLNAFFRPILLIITLPVNILTLGFFTFVINAMLLMMASGVIGGFKVAGFGSALIGSLIISIVSWLMTSFINEKGTVTYIDLRYNKEKNKWE